MDISKIPVPEVYTSESADFRFFMKWFELALSKIQYDTEEFFDLFDPLRCPADLLWMLGDTMGYKYDPRMSTAFNRLVLVYFMSMIRLKGSKDGVTLAAQVNLDQFNLKDQAKENSILSNRLEDTSIPSNSVFVEPHVEEGYIDLVYFSDEIPTDVCTEYTRPCGMYLVPHAGVRYDAKDKISIDARLTNIDDLNVSISPTHVGHYQYDDYSRMQRVDASDLNGNLKIKSTQSMTRDERETHAPSTHLTDTRNPVWYRNSDYEVDKSDIINPGYRALYSLQLTNNPFVVNSMLRHTSDVTSIKEDDVTVFDQQGRKFTTSDYASLKRSDDPIPVVESQLMGTLGDAMISVSAPDEDTQNNEDETPEDN